MNRTVWSVILALGLGSTAEAQLLVRPASPVAGAAAAEAAPPPNAPSGGASPFTGSVPSGAVSAQPVVLTLSNAIQRGLEHNLGVLTLEQQVENARGARWRSLSGMLPNVAAQAARSTQTTNLAAFGFNASLLPGIPSLIGPFSVFDARVFVSQPLVDFSALADVNRSAHALDAAKLDSRNARDLVTLVVTDLYLQAATAANRIAAVRTQVTTAEGLLKLATDLRNAGAAPGIDVVRAQVQLRAQQQRLIRVENDFAKDKLQLARAIGVPSAQPIELSDTSAIVPRLDLSLEQALQRATAGRTDYQAAVARVQAADADNRAARADALPTLHVNADYGALGSSPADAQGTYTISGSVHVPIFDAGRRKSRIIETASTLHQRQSEAADLEDRIASEVRSAFLDVDAADQQLAVARERIALVNQELGLAQTRFSAGVTSNLEVIQAQDEVAIATENELLSEYAFNVAKAALTRAVGGSTP
jgi:outer membrane protein TolC